MRTKMKLGLLGLTLMLVFSSGAFAAAVDFQAGGDRLEAVQNNDGGWDWPSDDGDPTNNSPKNTIGPIGMGLAKAYQRTGDAGQSAALTKLGTFLLAKTNNFSNQDGYMAAELDKVLGGTTYVDHVKANFYDPLAAGTYNKDGAGPLYTTASYVAGVSAKRASQGIPQLAAWDLGMGLYAAQAVGASTGEWITGVKAEIDGLDGNVAYDVIGLAGAIFGLASVNEDFDPTAGEHAAASSLGDLADILASYQTASGEFINVPSNVADNEEETQRIAYAVLALNEVNATQYWSNITKSVSFLDDIQLANGGWGKPDGTIENNEITGEALWAANVVPLPAAVWAGMMMMGSLGGVRVLRKKLQK